MNELRRSNVLAASNESSRCMPWHLPPARLQLQLPNNHHQNKPNERTAKERPQPSATAHNALVGGDGAHLATLAATSAAARRGRQARTPAATRRTARPAAPSDGRRESARAPAASVKRGTQMSETPTQCCRTESFPGKGHTVSQSNKSAWYKQTWSKRKRPA
eukprot:6104621-Pleurochrysis_carterae.AAC.5